MFSLALKIAAALRYQSSAYEFVTKFRGLLCIVKFKLNVKFLSSAAINKLQQKH